MVSFFLTQELNDNLQVFLTWPSVTELLYFFCNIAWKHCLKNDLKTLINIGFTYQSENTRLCNLEDIN